MTRDWTFTFSDPMGAVRTTQRAKWVDPRYKRYAAYKARLRLLANSNGVPSALDPKGSYSLRVNAWWKGKATCDLDNLIKGAMDALWKNDRRVVEIAAISHEGQLIDNSSCTMTVTRIR